MSSIVDSKNAKDNESERASNKNTENSKSNTASEKQFTRKIVEELGNRVRVTDTDVDNNLELFCYVHCGPEDNDIIRQCRGVVFNGDEIVMHAFPYTVEFNDTNIDLITKNIHDNFKNCVFYDAHEGTLIRMFNYSGRWYTSTHRKLNAFHSKWASKESFGTSFKRALESEIDNNKILRDSLPESGEGILDRFQSTLDPGKQYMFLVLNSEDNRIVCDAPESPKLFHVGTFIDGSLVMTENINIPYPNKHTFMNIDEVIEYVNKIDITKLQGVIAFTPNNRQYKILNKDYQDLFRARGNEPSIKYRYLQVRNNSNMVNMLKYLYPNFCSKFDEYENSLYSIANMIYRAYVQRFIKKKWVVVQSEEYKVIRDCHSWHEEDRKKNRISLEKVIEKLNEQTPTNLNKMIRRFNNEKNQQNELKHKLSNRQRSNTVSSPNISPMPNNTPKEEKDNSSSEIN